MTLGGGVSEKRLRWLGSSRKDLKQFPPDVQDEIGYALWLAQIGDKHPDAKPLTGFRGASVLEIVDDHDSDTYRVVYTVQFARAIYVLHAFKKKAKRGIATPREDIDLINQRLKEAQRLEAQGGRS
jgi:phage-related protein